MRASAGFEGPIALGCGANCPSPINALLRSASPTRAGRPSPPHVYLLISTLISGSSSLEQWVRPGGGVAQRMGVQTFLHIATYLDIHIVLVQSPSK
ncbi:hypothetical protein SCLCIDRAFT_446252 [Scleroderma citrinum Foug A]|uniref:Uncharacterized protein n=1 Tax=Scleroderma citrinum Foug A TaxID=1036808 RepID=A0A0C3DYT5_9AGAM|nr:hypothetical protein SCLCIDRAFT_446252 [Scleroderma citrinum Foug A]